MRIDADVLDAIRAARCEGSALHLQGQLDSMLYRRVNLALAAAGGVWNRQAQAHLFADAAADAIAGLLAEGEITTDAERGYFPTPPALIEEIIALAALSPGLQVLEPSAGTGVMAKKVAALGCAVDCVELDAGRADGIRRAGYARKVITGDFLAIPVARSYDRVVMNPPFTKQVDIRHVQRALRWVRPGGLVVAIMFAGLRFRTNELAVDFRNQVREARGSITPLPDHWFRGVRTVVAVIPVRQDEPTAAVTGSVGRVGPPQEAAQEGLF